MAADQAEGDPCQHPTLECSSPRSCRCDCDVCLAAFEILLRSARTLADAMNAAPREEAEAAAADARAFGNGFLVDGKRVHPERVIILVPPKSEPPTDIPETPQQVAARLRVERSCARLGKMLGDCMPPGHGFALLMFEFGEGGNLAYVSNGERGDMARTMREWLARYDAGKV